VARNLPSALAGVSSRRSREDLEELEVISFRTGALRGSPSTPAVDRPAPAAGGKEGEWFFNLAPSLGRDYSPRSNIFTYTPLIWIAIINRDPNIFSYTPDPDRDYYSIPSLVSFASCRSICHGDGSRACRRHGFAGDPHLPVLVFLLGSARSSNSSWSEEATIATEAWIELRQGAPKGH
jgi:hypothetical protein